MTATGAASWHRRARFLKYGLVAPMLTPVVRHTPLLDGGGMPPRVINYAGAGDFRTIGRIQAVQLMERARLGPRSRVLDIGSGMARMASALAHQFPSLDYQGFDVVRYGVEWSRKALRDRPSFGFTHVDVRNDFYNPRGVIEPDTFRFPYPDDRFDLAFATSVFTHLLHLTAEHYLSEAARVVRPGGRIYLTTFVHDPPWPPGARYGFRHAIGEAFCENAAEPEMAVAYPPTFWEAQAERHGLKLARRFDGVWRHGTAGDSQDAILLRVR